MIWPEGALPFELLANNYALDVISAYLGQRSLIVGTTRRSFDGRDGVYHNSLAVLQTESGRAELIAGARERPARRGRHDPARRESRAEGQRRLFMLNALSILNHDF